MTPAFLDLLDLLAETDYALSKCCLYRWSRAALLDRLLGPAEEYEYISTTAPSSPPPIIS